MFNDIFGDKYVCELESETDFHTAMANLNKYREALAKKADNLVVLSSDTITNVALEVQLFTDNRVIVL